MDSLNRTDGKPLFSYLSGLSSSSPQHQRGYSEVDVRSIVHSILRALQYLHQNCIRVGCIRPENIVVQSGTVHLIGWFVADILAESLWKEDLRQFPYFAAPEDLTEKPPKMDGATALVYLEEMTTSAAALDLWSVGMLAFVLLSGTAPFRKWTPYDYEMFVQSKRTWASTESPHRRLVNTNPEWADVSPEGSCDDDAVQNAHR